MEVLDEYSGEGSYQMPMSVVLAALKFADKGRLPTIEEWRYVLAMIMVGKISKKNAAKLMEYICLS